MILYHWTNELNARKAIDTNCLKKRKWKHFIEEKKSLLNGISFCLNQERWKSNHDVCFVIDLNKIENEYFLINGNKTYLRTQGIINPNFDPNAWKYEEDAVDECFIIGDIKNFNSLIIKTILK